MQDLIGRAMVVRMVVGTGVWAADAESPRFNLITHSEVWIERPAEAIGWYNFDTSEWMVEADASPEQARDAGTRSYDLNKPRFDCELRLLKKIAEQRH